MRIGNDGKPVFLSNHAGGILGGISTGSPSSPVRRQADLVDPDAARSIVVEGHDVEVATKGRHDPCVGIRAGAHRRGHGGLRHLRPLPAPRGQTGRL